MSLREQILAALFARLQVISEPTVRRNEALPQAVPAGGLIILRDGDPGEPDVTLNPRTEFYSHRAEIEAFVTQPAGGGGEAGLDALLAEIGAALAAERNLGGLAENLYWSAPVDLGAVDRGRSTYARGTHHYHHRVPGQRSAGR
jgi:hypothetical protein